MSLTFSWPGWPKGWATNSTQGDGKTQALSIADRQNGFRVDGVVTLPILNTIVKELASQVGYLLSGVINGLPGGTVLSWPTLESAVAYVREGVASVVAELPNGNPLSVYWGKTATASRVWAGGNAVYVAQVSVGGTVLKLNRATGATESTSTHESPYDIFGDGTSIYVLNNSIAVANQRTIQRYNTDMVLQQTYTLAASADNPTRMFAHAGGFIGWVNTKLRCYDGSFNLLWTYTAAGGDNITGVCAYGDSIYITLATGSTTPIRQISRAAGTLTNSVTVTLDCYSCATDGRWLYVGTVEDGDGYVLRQYTLDLEKLVNRADVPMAGSGDSYIYLLRTDGQSVVAVREDPTAMDQYSYVFSPSLERVAAATTSSVTAMTMDGQALYTTDSTGVRRRNLPGSARLYVGVASDDAYCVFGDRKLVPVCE